MLAYNYRFVKKILAFNKKKDNNKNSRKTIKIPAVNKFWCNIIEIELMLSESFICGVIFYV